MQAIDYGFPYTDKSAQWLAAQQAIDTASNKLGLPSWKVSRPLLSDGATNAKQRKLADGLRPAIVYMAPATLGSDALQDGRSRTVCANATCGCSKACLNLAGRGVQACVKAARLGKAILFLDYRRLYLAKLRCEVARHVRLAERDNLIAVFRHNGTSDIPLEDTAPDIYSDYSTTLQGIDYTKDLARMLAFLDGRTVAGRPWPTNYHLCFSRSELTPDDTVRDILNRGGTVAVVFRHKLPTQWLGYPVADATKHDWRWRDVPGTIQGLVALGPAIRDTSGFVVDVPICPSATPQVTDGYRYYLPTFVGASATGRIR
jgi:hypothetical protein